MQGMSLGLICALTQAPQISQEMSCRQEQQCRHCGAPIRVHPCTGVASHCPNCHRAYTEGIDDGETAE